MRIARLLVQNKIKHTVQNVCASDVTFYSCQSGMIETEFFTDSDCENSFSTNSKNIHFTSIF